MSINRGRVEPGQADERFLILIPFALRLAQGGVGKSSKSSFASARCVRLLRPPGQVIPTYREIANRGTQPNCPRRRRERNKAAALTCL